MRTKHEEAAKLNLEPLRGESHFRVARLEFKTIFERRYFAAKIMNKCFPAIFQDKTSLKGQ